MDSTPAQKRRPQNPARHRRRLHAGRHRGVCPQITQITQMNRIPAALSAFICVICGYIRRRAVSSLERECFGLGGDRPYSTGTKSCP